MSVPEVVLLDVNETLSDMSPMADRFAEVGAPPHLAPLWFAGVLRDGFGLTAAGANEPFADVARGVLRTVLAGVELDRDLDGAVAHVMAGMGALDVHPDVPDGLRALRDGGSRLYTLTNGATSLADDLLTRAGCRDTVDGLLGVADAPAWKPAPGSYRWALERCEVAAGDAVLVAVHPWDVDGAARVGMRTAWLDRRGTPYPEHLTPPDVTAATLTDLAEALRRS